MTVVPAAQSRPLAQAERIYALVPTLLSYVASFSILFMMVLVCADIGMRFFFNSPINGVAEVISNLIVAAVFLQFGSTIRDGRLIRADFIMGRWNKTRPALAIVADVFYFTVGTLALAVAFQWLLRDFIQAYSTNEFTGAEGAYIIRLWPFKLGVVVGCGVALIECLRVIAHGLSGLRWEQTRGGPAVASLKRDAFPILIFVAVIAAFFLVNFDFGLSSVQVAVVLLAGLVIAVSIGMPIAFALLGLSFVGIWLTRNNFAIAENALGISAAGTIRSYEFGVVPLFVIMGLMLEKADVGRDAFVISCALLRPIRGGLGIATVMANAIFASITGSSMASAAVFSRIAVAPMVENGYTKRFAVGVVAGSSVLGMIIPPSILMIIYGLIAEASIGKLFIAGIVPGILLAAAYSVLNVVLATYFPRFTGVPHPIDQELMSARLITVRLIPVVCVIALVMGGIYLGVFTPTEAGAVGALAAFVIGLARRKLTFKIIRDVVLETGYISAALLFLIIAANFFARMLTLSTLPVELTATITQLNVGMPTFLIVYFIVILFLGMLLDSVSIMLIMLPIVLPVVAALGADPIWFGLITIVSIEIGLLTPPFGMSVFVVKATLPQGYVTLGDVFIGAAPFVVVMTLVTIILMIFPKISLILLQ